MKFEFKNLNQIGKLEGYDLYELRRVYKWLRSGCALHYHWPSLSNDKPVQLDRSEKSILKDLQKKGYI